MSTTKNILFIDDEKDVTFAMKIILEETGLYHVGTFNDPESGATFGDKINLSNTTNGDSWRVEIAGEEPNVIVSWWETNQTSDTPVARISTDNGATFGPMLVLATNGTLGEAEAAEEEGE
jgi:hypothetical protein